MSSSDSASVQPVLNQYLKNLDAKMEESQSAFFLPFFLPFFLLFLRVFVL